LASSGTAPQTDPSSAGFFLSDSRARTFLLSLLLATVTVATYYQVHHHPFSDLDDAPYLVDNANLHHGLTLTTIWWSCRALNMANWIPLSWMTYAVEYSYFGAEPAGYHVVNLLLHALNVVLVFWVLKRATGYTARSFMVAALFALHPMNVEPVVWIAELKTLLSMVFFLLALGAYRWYASEPRPDRYALVFVLFGLGLAAKSQVITLPAVLLLWDYWPLQRMFPPSLSAPSDKQEKNYPAASLGWLTLEKLPLLFLCFVDAALTVYTQKSVRLGLMPSLSLRFKNAVYSYWLYLVRAFWPSSMAPESPQLGRFVAWWQIVSILLLFGAITALVVAARRHRYLPVGWFWFLGTLLPMIGLLQPGQQGMADRFVYQAYLGVFIVVCWGAAESARLRHISAARLAGAGALALLALTLVTYRQIGYWNDNPTLWLHAARVVKHHWVAEENVGMYLIKQGKVVEAMEHYYTANAINPDDAVSNLTIGFYEQTMGKPQPALLHYQRALQARTLPPAEIAVIWKDMGVAYGNLGDLNKARECFAKSASLSQQ
jgi:tetratricopeptide (TPR) repeat protein